MKTIVYQSYRTHDVAPWLARCMRSTASWAAAQGFEYQFIDDRFLDYVPDWYRKAAGGNIQIVTNLARLLAAKELLAEGWERTIWIDADIIVFAPEAFRVDVTAEFAFCREVWCEKQWGSLIKTHRVNNSVVVFTRGNSFLDYGIWAHESLARDGTHLYSHGTTSRMLTLLHAAAPMPLLTSIGMSSPIITLDISRGGSTMVNEYTRTHGAPIHAANLCASMAGSTFCGVTLMPADYDSAIKVLERTRGAVFNAALPTETVAPALQIG